MVNDDRTSTDQFWPWLASPVSGRVDVSFYDRRFDPVEANVDVFHSFTLDLASFRPNVRVSNSSFNIDLDVSDCTEPFCKRIGDYIGMSAVSVGNQLVIHPVWMGTRDATYGDIS